MNKYSDEFYSQTEKVSDKWSSYLDIYDREFERLKDSPVSILEIRVQNGGHLEILSRFFKNASAIVGCDVDERCKELVFSDSRISVVVADADSDDAQSQIFSKSVNFDVVIDDGSHMQWHIVRNFLRYFPWVKDGGIYIVEDLHTSYWQSYQGGLFNPYSGIGFFKRLVDVINQEHWHGSVTLNDFLRRQANHFQVSIDTTILESIRSIKFANSMCLIERKVLHNTLGNRLASGTQQSVSPVKCVEDFVQPERLVNEGNVQGLEYDTEAINEDPKRMASLILRNAIRRVCSIFRR